MLPNWGRTLPRRQKDRASRLGKYLDWLSETGQGWFNVDLAAYGPWLETRYQPYTASVYEAAVRSRYRELLDDPQLLRELAYDVYRQGTIAEPWEAFLTRVQANVRAATERPANRKPAKRPARSKQRHLTPAQVEALLALPDPTTLPGLRDLAVISLMVCTGLRDAEIAGVTVEDLFDRLLDGTPALHVPACDGCVERFVVYGEAIWALEIVKRWLEAAHIDRGAAFRGFKRDEKARATPLSQRAVRNILAAYPIEIDGDLVTVKPLDIRYTYARHLYESGVDLTVIQQNLGFASAVTLLDYIDVQSPRQGRPTPPALYHYDLSRLREPDSAHERTSHERPDKSG